MSRDLRRYSRQTNLRLIIGGLLLLFVVGGGLIYIIYGRDAAIFGLLCLAAGLLPVVVIILILRLLEWLAKKADSG
jgi:hypothetical protein